LHYQCKYADEASLQAKGKRKQAVVQAELGLKCSIIMYYQCKYADEASLQTKGKRKHRSDTGRIRVKILSCEVFPMQVCRRSVSLGKRVTDTGIGPGRIRVKI
jgi:hypothetical protein